MTGFLKRLLGGKDSEVMTPMKPPPLVAPDQPLLDDFVIRLPFPMARRIDDGSLVFWHTPKGLTFWIDCGKRKDDSADPVEGWRSARSDEASDECIERDGELTRFGYRLAEDSDDGRQPAFYGFVAEGINEFTLAAYFNAPETIDEVMETWRSIRLEA